MALYGALDALRPQLPDPGRFAAAWNLLEEAKREDSPVYQLLYRLRPGQTERIDLPDGAFALPQAYHTRPRSEGRWEHHQRFIDVQAVLEGAEDLEIGDAGRLTAEEDLTPAQDVVFLRAPERRAVFRLESGLVAVLFPADAHLGGVAVDSSALVRKIVIKVPELPVGD